MVDCVPADSVFFPVEEEEVHKDMVLDASSCDRVCTILETSERSSKDVDGERRCRGILLVNL